MKWVLLYWIIGCYGLTCELEDEEPYLWREYATEDDCIADRDSWQSMKDHSAICRPLTDQFPHKESTNEH